MPAIIPGMTPGMMIPGMIPLVWFTIFLNRLFECEDGGTLNTHTTTYTYISEHVQVHTARIP